MISYLLQVPVFTLILITLPVWAHEGPHGPLLGAKCGIQNAEIKATTLAVIEQARRGTATVETVKEKADTGRLVDLDQADRGLAEKAEAQAIAGDIEGVFTTIRGLRWSDRGPVMEDIVTTLIDAGKLDTAVQITQHMEMHEARVRSLLTIARAQIHAGNTDAARNNLDRAVDVALSLGTPYSRAETLITIARTLTAAGDPQRARQVLRYAQNEVDKINDPYDLDVILSEIAKSYAMLGDLETALQTVRGKASDPECR